MKKVVALLLATFFIAGCSTMEGFGKDVKKLGDKIEDAAN